MWLNKTNVNYTSRFFQKKSNYKKSPTHPFSNLDIKTSRATTMTTPRRAPPQTDLGIDSPVSRAAVEFPNTKMAIFIHHSIEYTEDCSKTQCDVTTVGCQLQVDRAKIYHSS